MGRLPYPMDMAPPPPYPVSHHSTAPPRPNPPPASLSRPVRAAEPRGYSRPVQATETTASSSPQFVQHRPTARAVRPSQPLPREPGIYMIHYDYTVESLSEKCEIVCHCHGPINKQTTLCKFSYTFKVKVDCSLRFLCTCML